MERTALYVGYLLNIVSLPILVISAVQLWKKHRTFFQYGSYWGCIYFHLFTGLASSVAFLLVAIPWQTSFTLECKYHVLILTSAATASCLKIIPMTLDCLVRVVDMTFYRQFHCKSPYNHLLSLVVVFEVAPFLAYETSTMYPADDQDPTKCKNNEQVTGYELYLVSITVYLISVAFVVYTMFLVAVSYKSAAEEQEILITNQLSILLSVTSVSAIVFVNPCYDPTTTITQTNILVSWQHHEEVFSVGIAIKNIIDAIALMAIISDYAQQKLRRVFTSNIETGSRNQLVTAIDIPQN